VTISGSWGDCLYVDETAAGHVWSGSIWVHDSFCTRTGRSGISIVSGSHVTIERDHFDKLGMHVLDIEPDTSAGGGTYVTFRNNTVGSYGLGLDLHGLLLRGRWGPRLKRPRCDDHRQHRDWQSP
jgi:hypothetical protein